MEEKKLSQRYLTELLTVTKCELCGGKDIFTDIETGEEVCSNCGCVVNDVVLSRRKHNLSHISGGKTYNPSQSIYNKSANTTISGTKDAFGAQLGRETLDKMRRLKHHDNISKTSDNVDRNLSIAMSELDRICTRLHLPLVVKERGASIYRKSLTCDMIRGRSIEAFVAASVYAACRLLNMPRQLKVVSEISKRGQSEVSSTYRFILRELNLKPPLDNSLKYVSGIVSTIKAPQIVELTALDLLKQAKDKQVLKGKDPIGVASGAVLLACELEGFAVTQRVISEAGNVTGITMRSRYRDLKKALQL